MLFKKKKKKKKSHITAGTPGGRALIRSAIGVRSVPVKGLIDIISFPSTSMYYPVYLILHMKDSFTACN